MKGVLLFGLLAALLLATASVAQAVPPWSEVEITPKVSVKGPAAKAKPPKTAEAATGVLGSSLPEGAGRWAIVIGISDYQGSANDLECADDDARDFYRALVDVYGFDAGKVTLLVDGDATRGNIVGAINSLKEKASPGDEVVFFYSGHGARGRFNDGDSEAVDEAIVPWECTAEALIWDGELASWFSGLEASRIILIFDCCYAGGMTDLKANGRIVVMACSENGVSYEFTSLGNGQFTYYFVEQGIIRGEADRYDHCGDGNGDGAQDVTVEEAFDYAKANCAHQAPAISDLFLNDLLP
ncbi:MAG: caspase family protein [Candidatus Nezhaarchaeota archaeon]|nr:caspase family protein [Candidatus Nezhaarchaeota archaeon]